MTDATLYRKTADLQSRIKELREAGKPYCYLFDELDKLITEILDRKHGHR